MDRKPLNDDARSAYRNALTWLRHYPIHEVEQMLIVAAEVEQLPGVARSTRRQTLSINAAREIVGVSRRTLYLWMDAGKIEYVRTAGGSRRIFADSLWRQQKTDQS
jgi:excisionase family DNA binding protein